jgi:hypothetical protein
MRCRQCPVKQRIAEPVFFSFGQPGLNEPRKIMARTVEKGVQIVGFGRNDRNAIGTGDRELAHGLAG